VTAAVIYKTVSLMLIVILLLTLTLTLILTVKLMRRSAVHPAARLAFWL